ncbi:hypothetical protein T06_1375 [Trichinella sp. T6]|nr:hypothetical protein T06_1375 [Trichinella sp. T6]
MKNSKYVTIFADNSENRTILAENCENSENCENNTIFDEKQQKWNDFCRNLRK